MNQTLRLCIVGRHRSAHPFSLLCAGLNNLISCDGARSAELEERVHEYGGVPPAFVDV